jgi:hypothetical protein
MARPPGIDDADAAPSDAWDSASLGLEDAAGSVLDAAPTWHHNPCPALDGRDPAGTAAFAERLAERRAVARASAEPTAAKAELGA